ncbi:hypothetical protein EON67_03820, partial [archaeon]
MKLPQLLTTLCSCLARVVRCARRSVGHCALPCGAAALHCSPLAAFMCAGSAEVFLNVYNAYSVLQPTRIAIAYLINQVAARGATSAAFISDSIVASRKACLVDQDLLNAERVGPLGPANISILPANDTAQERRTLREFFAFVSRARPDIVVICASYTLTVRVLRYARANRVDPRAFIVANLLADPRFPEEVELQSSGVLDRSSWYARRFYSRPPSVDDPCTDLSPVGCVDGAMFEEWTQNQYGTDVPIEQACAFAAIQVLGQAVVQAGSGDSEAVIGALRLLHFSTVFGTTSMGRKTHMSTRDTYMRQAQMDGTKLVAPPQFADGVLVYPRPTWAQVECTRTRRCGNHGACTPDGSCDCDVGWSGSGCSVRYDIPALLFILLGLVGLVVGTIFAIHFARRSKRQLAFAQQRAKEREAMEEVSRRVHVRTLSYASHELANPLFAIIAT